jgi:hypothetical protein
VESISTTAYEVQSQLQKIAEALIEEAKTELTARSRKEKGMREILFLIGLAAVLYVKADRLQIRR